MQEKSRWSSQCGKHSGSSVLSNVEVQNRVSDCSSKETHFFSEEFVVGSKDLNSTTATIQEITSVTPSELHVCEFCSYSRHRPTEQIAAGNNRIELNSTDTFFNSTNCKVLPKEASSTDNMSKPAENKIQNVELANKLVSDTQYPTVFRASLEKTRVSNQECLETKYDSRSLQVSSIPLQCWTSTMLSYSGSDK